METTNNENNKQKNNKQNNNKQIIQLLINNINIFIIFNLVNCV